MDFTKFIAFLETRSLYLANLPSFEDRYEGALTHPTVEEMAQINRELLGDSAQWATETTVEHLRQFRKMMYVSCWHLNEVESAAMWRLYSKSHEGVAVQSTFERMTQALAPASAQMTIGLVDYIDYERDTFPWTNSVIAALHKRLSFAHEQELRILHTSASGGDGVTVAVDVPALIETIYVAPMAPRWCADLVESVIRRYGIVAPVVHSSLYGEPEYGRRALG